VDHWRTRLAISESIQDELSSCAILLSGGLHITPADAQSVAAARQLSYRVYRWLNVAHVFTYSMRAGLCWKDAEDTKRLVELGLLTVSEAGTLQSTLDASGSARETVFAWLLAEVSSAAKAGVLSDAAENELQAQLTNLNRHMNISLAVEQPNSWVVLMCLVVDGLILLFVVANPLINFSTSACFQGMTIVSTFLLTFPFVAVQKMNAVLDDPYAEGGVEDVFDVDTFLSQAENRLFDILRANLPPSDALQTPLASPNEVVPSTTTSFETSKLDATVANTTTTRAVAFERDRT